MNTGNILCVLFAVTLAGSTTGAVAQEVYETLGNIYVESEGHKIQLTKTGLDHLPKLSPDQKFVVFSRTTERRIAAGPCCEGEPPKADQLWMIMIDGAGERLLVRESDGPEVKHMITAFKQKQFSSDGRLLYFLTPAWAVSSALHVYNFVTNESRYVMPSNSFRVLSACKRSDYTDFLVTRQHRYFVLGGSYDWYWLYPPDGEAVGPIGDTLAPLEAACG